MTKHVRSLSATISDNIQASAHVIAEAGQEAVTRSSNAIQHILHYDQLPEWMKIDPYIKLGYRRQRNSFRDCFWSLFYLHNESVNIWSHLLPAIAYLLYLLRLDFQLIHSDIKVPTTDKVFFQLYVVCTLGCLLLSAIYHCINSHSEHISRCFLKLDYFGIVLNVTGTIVSAAYFGLYGNLLLQGFYIIFFVVCAAFVFYLLLHDNIDGPGAVLQRAKIIMALGSTWFAPVLHMILKDGIEKGAQGFAIKHTAVMVILHCLAFFFYAMHIPEKWWPLTFDVWGASHQIFHILIDVGQVVFLLGLREVMLRHHLPAGRPSAFHAPNETSLSLHVQPNMVMWSGSQQSFETGLSVLVDSSVALWAGIQA